MGTMNVVDQERARWQHQQGQSSTEGVVDHGTRELVDGKMASPISNLQLGTDGTPAHASKKTKKNLCGCVPPPPPPLTKVLPSLSVTTSLLSLSNSSLSSDSSSITYASPLILVSHPSTADSPPSTPPPSLSSLCLCPPPLDVQEEEEEEPRSNSAARPPLNHSASLALLAAPPVASPAGSVLSFQSIAGETYPPDAPLAASSPFDSFLAPSLRSATLSRSPARSRSFDPASFDLASLITKSSNSIALLSSVSRLQQCQHPQQSRHPRPQRRDNSQPPPPMDTSQSSSGSHRARHRKKSMHPLASTSSAARQRSRSTSSLVHLAQSFMEDSLLFRSSAVVSPPKDLHHSSARGRANRNKFKRPLSFFASMTTINSVSTSSPPKGTSAVSPCSSSTTLSNGVIVDGTEAKRIQGQNVANQGRRQRPSKQPRKSLADLLFEAQSHYISHRYPQALALYLQAVNEHDSVQACNSLYALYTPAKQERGLVRSDTRATRALIHALQIWARKRWPQTSVSSNLVISSLMNLEPLLDNSLATPTDSQSPTSPHPLQKQRTSSQPTSPTSPTSASSPEEKTKRRDLLESFFADGSSRFWRRGRTEAKPSHQALEEQHHHHHHHLSHRGALTDDNLALGNESEDDEEESGSAISDSDGSDDDGDESDINSLLDEAHFPDSDSEEEELDPEQRGQATGEIEDIVQRLCQMIQKGVLGLDEPIVKDAIAMLQWISQELASEADEYHKQERQEKLLQQSSLGANPSIIGPSGNSSEHGHVHKAPQVPCGLLLLSQPMQFSDADDEMVPVASPVKQTVSSPPPRTFRHNTHRATHLTSGQRALDQTFCRAMRIRIMSMLGWVHHQRHEYKYGAQAYAVCSEITPRTGRIQVDTLQRKAVELMRHCQEMELQQQRDTTTSACSSGASVNSIPSSSATLEVPTPSTVSTAEAPSICPLSAEGDQCSIMPQQQQQQQHQHQQQTLATDAQILEAAIRIASLAMESSHKPTVYEGAQVLAAEWEAQRASVLVTEPTATTSVSDKVPAKDESTLSLNVNKGRKDRPRSRAQKLMDGTIKAGSQHSRPLRIQTEPNLLGKASPSVTKTAATALSPSFSRRPSMGSHSYSMPLLQPNQHHRHHHHHKPSQQTRPKASGLIFGQPPKNPTQVTLSTCGHCGKKGTQMPLCVCKSIRYCNRECRVAGMQLHRTTGCHAAYIGGS